MTNIMTVTITAFEASALCLNIAGNDEITIDWGDGSEVETHTLSEYCENEWYGARHTYIYDFPPKTFCTITITGKNITHLELCGDTKMTNLDVSKNTELTYLGCINGQLTSLDISKNTKLTYLDCSYNQLTGLDIGKNTELAYLDCSHNQLTSLDISKNIALQILYYRSNKLAKLDVSNCAALTHLDCSDNQLTNDALDALFEMLYNNSNNSALVNFFETVRNLAQSNLVELRKTENVSFEELLSLVKKPELSHYVIISQNPGTNTCNSSIAKSKGWGVWEDDENEGNDCDDWSDNE